VQNHRAAGAVEANLAQILKRRSRGVFEPNLPGKARQFYSLYSEQLTNLGKTDQFEVPNCQVCKYLTIWVLNMKIICEELKLCGV
jgi:hypothetical protein